MTRDVVNVPVTNEPVPVSVVALQKESGVVYRGRCPFHKEKTPSFFVRPDLGTYKCFSCNKSGYSSELNITVTGEVRV